MPEILSIDSKSISTAARTRRAGVAGGHVAGRRRLYPSRVGLSSSTHQGKAKRCRRNGLGYHTNLISIRSQRATLRECAERDGHRNTCVEIPYRQINRIPSTGNLPCLGGQNLRYGCVSARNNLGANSLVCIFECVGIRCRAFPTCRRSRLCYVLLQCTKAVRAPLQLLTLIWLTRPALLKHFFQRRQSGSNDRCRPRAPNVGLPGDSRFHRHRHRDGRGVHADNIRNRSSRIFRESTNIRKEPDNRHVCFADTFESVRYNVPPIHMPEPPFIPWIEPTGAHSRTPRQYWPSTG